jgi:hypothetical protein
MEKNIQTPRLELNLKTVKGWSLPESRPPLIGVAWTGVRFDRAIEVPGFFGFVELVLVRRTWRLEIDFLIHKTKEGTK